MDSGGRGLSPAAGWVGREQAGAPHSVDGPGLRPLALGPAGHGAQAADGAQRPGWASRGYERLPHTSHTIAAQLRNVCNHRLCNRWACWTPTSPEQGTPGRGEKVPLPGGHPHRAGGGGDTVGREGPRVRSERWSTRALLTGEQPDPRRLCTPAPRTFTLDPGTSHRRCHLPLSVSAGRWGTLVEFFFPAQLLKPWG